MLKGHLRGSDRLVRALYEVGQVGGLSDGALLGRFAGLRDQAAELAFAALVDRHGPMVLRICRSALGDEHDAEDAFQATFLVLVRRAASVRDRESLGGWLCEVALRVSANARVASARRRAHERRAARAEPASPGVAERDRSELIPILHEEIGRLPGRYRAVIVLCCLEGRTHEDAARHLGWPAGTVKSRLSRGRDRLRARLARRGIGLSTGLIAATLEGQVRATASQLPAALASSTARVAWLVASGLGPAGTVAGPVSSLVGGACRSLLMTRLNCAAAASLGLLAAVAFVAGGTRADEPGKVPGRPAVAPKERRVPLEAVARTMLEPGSIEKVRPRFGGLIVRVLPKLGQSVRKGDPLVEIESAELAGARAELRDKHERWRRDLALLKRRATPAEAGPVAGRSRLEAEGDERRSRLDFDRSIDALSADLGVPRQELDPLREGPPGPAVPERAGDGKLTIRAGADGNVVERAAVEGNTCGKGDALMAIAPMDRLWFEAEVARDDRGKVRLGQGVEVRYPFGDRAIRAVVGFVAREGPNGARAFRVGGTIPNPGGDLKANMLIRVIFDPIP